MSNDNSMKVSDIGGVPTFKFDAIGDRCKGRIVAIMKRQSTDMDSGEPLTWPDGRPKMYTSITLDLDGEERTVNGAGGNFEVGTGEGRSFEAALVAAAKAAGASSIDAGATLEIVHSGLGKKTGTGKNAPRLYSMRYTPAKASMPVSGLFTDEDES